MVAIIYIHFQKKYLKNICEIWQSTPRQGKLPLNCGQLVIRCITLVKLYLLIIIIYYTMMVFVKHNFLHSIHWNYRLPCLLQAYDAKGILIISCDILFNGVVLSFCEIFLSLSPFDFIFLKSSLKERFFFFLEYLSNQATPFSAFFPFFFLSPA